MRRREFIALLGGAATWPLVANAQQAIPVVGLLSSRSLDDSELAAIRDGLSASGYAAVRTLEIEYRSADGNFDRLPTLAAELVRLITDAEIEDAVARLARRPVQALMCGVDSFFADKGKLLIALAAQRPSRRIHELRKHP